MNYREQTSIAAVAWTPAPVATVPEAPADRPPAPAAPAAKPDRTKLFALVNNISAKVYELISDVDNFDAAIALSHISSPQMLFITNTDSLLVKRHLSNPLIIICKN